MTFPYHVFLFIFHSSIYFFFLFFIHLFSFSLYFLRGVYPICILHNDRLSHQYLPDFFLLTRATVLLNLEEVSWFAFESFHVYRFRVWENLPHSDIWFAAASAGKIFPIFLSLLSFISLDGCSYSFCVCCGVHFSAFSVFGLEKGKSNDTIVHCMFSFGWKSMWSFFSFFNVVSYLRRVFPRLIPPPSVTRARPFVPRKVALINRPYQTTLSCT